MHHTTAVRRGAAIITVLVALSALAACGGSDSGAPRTTAATSPTADPTVRIRAMVDAAALKGKDLGIKAPTEEETTVNLTMPCGQAPEASYVAGHYWAYRGAKIDVLSHGVYGFSPEPGSAVVGEARTALTACRTWDWAGTFTMKVLGEFRVAEPDGVDATMGYCHQGTVRSGPSKGDKVYICDGLVSRGQLVAKVDTLKLTLSDAQKELRKALPLAAAALVRAVPA